MPRSTKPQISFADWELLQQGIVLEPLLQNISDFLDDHEELKEQALAKATPPSGRAARYHPGDQLLGFLNSL
jgi:hypothetical protein